MAGADAAMSEPDLVNRLARLDSCAVSDALDTLGLTGVVHGLRAFGTARRVAGLAITVELQRVTPQLLAQHATQGGKPRHLGTAAVDASGPGDVIVVATDGGPETAGWGGILSLGAKIRGVSGVLVDGACRDVDEALEFDLPLYARNAVPCTARGRVMETAWNEPISFGHLTVSPGDLVIADRSGVVFLGAERAGEIVTVAEGIAARERAMMDAVRAGVGIAQVMGDSYETLLMRSHES
jgi:4-hydroxy-4-methyl-2-oxoglutarate aldolase